jgi:hypothetical protein
MRMNGIHATTSDQDLVRVSAGQLIDVLTGSFAAFIRNGSISRHPAVFLRGQPGAGKSQAVSEIASRLRIETGADVRMTDVRLMMFNPVDLRGIPVADMATRTAIWLKPAILDLADDPEVVNILFLDEITAAPQSLQAIAYQIALDRKVGEHHLPPNTFVIAAGNRPQDNAATFAMSSALKNRMIHFEVGVDVESWLEWAVTAGIHEDLMEAVRKNPEVLNTTDFGRDKPVIVTPRSWEIASNLLKTLGGTIEDHPLMMASVFGTILWNEICRSGHVDDTLIDDIISGNHTDVPGSLSDSLRIVRRLEGKTRLFIDDREKTTNVLRYLTKIPPDHGLSLFRMIVKADIRAYDVTSLPEYAMFIERIRSHDKA